MRQLRILCLDPDGGFGGSSRSLYASLKHIDLAVVAPEVWSRRKGPTEKLYEAIGVRCTITGGMPSASSVPSVSRNVYYYALKAAEYLRSAPFRHSLLQALEQRFDAIHLNHEGLFLLARWLRPRVTVPITMHHRKTIADTAFARWQMRVISEAVDYCFFITENEEKRFRDYGGRARGCVLYNIFTLPASEPTPWPGLPQDGRFRIASLSNYAWQRGVDRLMEIAAELKRRACNDVVFVIAGKTELTHSLPGMLGRVARAGGDLATYAKALGVDDMFVFLGHVDEPERVIVACDAVAKPTRLSNPWSRDLIEALGLGRPAITVGNWQGFVENDVTGVIFPEFDTLQMSDAIQRLVANRDEARRMGRAGRRRILAMCDGTTQAAKLAEQWCDLARTTHCERPSN